MSMNQHRALVIAGAVVAIAAIVLFQSGGEQPPDVAMQEAGTPSAPIGTISEPAAPMDPAMASGLDSNSKRSIDGLVLHGTMVTGADGAGHAFLSNGEDSATARYSVGEVLPGGGQLMAVRDRSIEVQTDVGIEVLTLDFTASGGIVDSRSEGVAARDASLAAAMQEARGDDVPPADPAPAVVPVVAPTIEDRRRQDAIDLALEGD